MRYSYLVIFKMTTFTQITKIRDSAVGITLNLGYYGQFLIIRILFLSRRYFHLNANMR